MFLQYPPVVLLLVRLVDDVTDEDLEVVNSSDYEQCHTRLRSGWTLRSCAPDP